MKLVKTIVSVLIVISMIFLITSAANAVYVNPNFGGHLTFTFNTTTAHVGDTVTLTIHPVNTGIGNWENVENLRTDTFRIRICIIYMS